MSSELGTKTDVCTGIGSFPNRKQVTVSVHKQWAISESYTVFLSTGTIISHTLVLTSCVKYADFDQDGRVLRHWNPIGSPLILVIAKYLLPDSPYYKSGVDEIFVHPGCKKKNNFTILKNFALIRPEKVIYFTNMIAKASVPRKLPGNLFDYFHTGTNKILSQATGWGFYIKRYDPVTYLRSVNMYILPRKECEIFCNKHNYEREESLCARPVPPEDVCTSFNEGSPLLLRHQDYVMQIGMTSKFGRKVCFSHHIAVFTSIEDSADWINSIIEKEAVSFAFHIVSFKLQIVIAIIFLIKTFI